MSTSSRNNALRLNVPMVNLCSLPRPSRANLHQQPGSGLGPPVKLVRSHPLRSRSKLVTHGIANASFASDSFPFLLQDVDEQTGFAHVV